MLRPMLLCPVARRFDISGSHELQCNISENSRLDRTCTYSASTCICCELAKKSTLCSTAYHVDCLIIFTCTLFNLFHRMTIFHCKTLVDATNNFSDCFRNRLSCLLAEFTDSCRNISGRCEFRCIRINKALKCRSFFCHNLKLAKSVLISFADPLTTAFLNTPQSNDILKEGNLSSISTFIRDVVMLRFLIDNRFCKLCSKQ